MTRHRTDVAILGGGIMGWSLAWHLKKLNPSLAVLVIDPAPDQASALRGTGGVRSQFGTEINIRLSLKSIAALNRFQTETGCELEWQQTGYLLVTSREERLDVLRRFAAMQNRIGGRTKVLDASGLKPWAKVMRTDDLVGGTFSPMDGVLNSPKLVVGLIQASLELGVRTLKKSVTEVGEGQLLVQNGEVTAKTVILAAGHGLRSLGTIFGLDLPLTSERHQLYRAEKHSLPSNLPMIVDADTSLHYRVRGSELLVGFDDPSVRIREAEPTAQPEFEPTGIPNMLQSAAVRCPNLGLDKAKLDGWAGWYTTTPDGAPIVDWARENLLVLGGFGGHGIMHGLAIGDMAAHMIVESKPGPAEFKLNHPSSEIPELVI